MVTTNKDSRTAYLGNTSECAKGNDKKNVKKRVCQKYRHTLIIFTWSKTSRRDYMLMIFSISSNSLPMLSM